jgi:hypothetical protein
MAKTAEEIADAMYKLVEDAQGVKKLKPMDLTKAIVQMYGDEVDKKACKGAIKLLIDSGRCIYTYFGGSFIEIPQKEGAANE